MYYIFIAAKEISENKECSENKFLISERVNSIHFEPGLR